VPGQDSAEGHGDGELSCCHLVRVQGVLGRFALMPVAALKIRMIAHRLLARDHTQ
jgi:hypothetical protein